MSYSPLYKQDVMWVAVLDDGSTLREWDDDGKSHSFNEIDKSKLRKFSLISEKFDYFIDCQTGLFHIDNREFVFPLAGLNLKYGEGIIHYKDASTEFVSSHVRRNAYDGFEIASYHMGYKVSHDNIKSQIIFNVISKVFEMELTFLNIQKTIKWSVKL